MPLPYDPQEGMEGTGAVNSTADAGIDKSQSAASGSGDPLCGGPPEPHEECGDPTKESADAANTGTRPKVDRVCWDVVEIAGCNSLWHSSSQPAPAPLRLPGLYAACLPHPIYHYTLETSCHSAPAGQCLGQGRPQVETGTPCTERSVLHRTFPACERALLSALWHGTYPQHDVTISLSVRIRGPSARRGAEKGAGPGPCLLEAHSRDRGHCML